MIDTIKEFLKLETAGGLMLMGATVIALIVANSPLASYYAMFLNIPVAVQVGALEVAKPLLLWINDGLMAVFFFLVGMELKREILEGELSSMRKVVMPVAAALGGIIVPALVYLWFNYDDPVARAGWAIPAATDIAFALGILALLGSRVPIALKVFLVSLAIGDDIGAIVIIALFYTDELSVTALVFASITVPILAVLNYRGVTKIEPYLFVGVILWLAVLKSGVHATLAGVVLAFFIPLRAQNENGRSPLRELEHNLHPTVAFAILPLFAFANAGINLTGLSIDTLMAPVPLGIALGLFIGKQVGVFLFAAVVVLLGLAERPKGVSWMSLYGVSVLTGIGFTMSLFVSSLAFEISPHDIASDRLGILVGTVLSAALGYLVLQFSLPKVASSEGQ